MSILNHPYSTQSWINARRNRDRNGDPRPRGRTAARSGLVPVMGPASRAPGIAIMGAPGRGVDVMGEPAPATRITVMGGADQAAPLVLFGVSEARFVDSLFSPSRRLT